MDKDKIEVLSQSLSKRFAELEKTLSDPSIHQNPTYPALAKEHSALSGRLGKIKEWQRAESELRHMNELLHSGDAEMAELARTEKTELESRAAQLLRELEESLFPRDPNNEKNILVEIRAGAGGDEAALFAQELSRMYLKFAERKGFIIETVSLSLSDHDGIKEGVFFIEKKPGDNSPRGPYSYFKYESGVHRVQRVPETEASGRVHTSTVTVAVLPEAEEVDVQVRHEDLRIDTYRASGHGGQHLQKTDSAVRITHLPSNIVVQCQDERSQQKNREKAMKMLRAKLYQIAQENHAKKIASARKKQVGTGDRSEKIRTYNFHQDRITDHRIGYNAHNIHEFLEGNMEDMVRELEAAERKAEEENRAAE